MEDACESGSSHTYRDYAMEYSQTQEYALWKPRPLIDSISYRIIGEKGIIGSIVDECEEESDKKVSILDMSNLDECLIEPLFAIPEGCRDTENKLLHLSESPPGSFLASLSMKGEKHLMFAIRNCIICSRSTYMDVYIPRRIIHKIIIDTGYQNVACSARGSSPKTPFHRVKLLTNASKDIKKKFEHNRKHKVTPDHMPASTDGYERFVLDDIIVYIVLSPQRRPVLTEYGNSSTLMQRSRCIDVVCLATL